MKKTLHLLSAIILGLLILFVSSCEEDDIPVPPPTAEQKIESALDAFVADLVATPPTSLDISSRVKTYLSIQPVSFFGATVTLLDSASKATYSPYWYRLNDTLAYKNQADTAYHIDEQSWLRRPIDEQKSVWTDPYFDAGGGEIWMKTRSVPVMVNGKIVAVATTDLALE